MIRSVFSRACRNSWDGYILVQCVPEECVCFKQNIITWLHALIFCMNRIKLDCTAWWIDEIYETWTGLINSKDIMVIGKDSNVDKINVGASSILSSGCWSNLRGCLEVILRQKKIKCHSHAALFDVVTPPLSCPFSYLYIGPNYPTPYTGGQRVNFMFVSPTTL